MINKSNTLLLCYLILNFIGQSQCEINLETSIDLVVTANVGQTIRLPCKVENLGSNHLSWKRSRDHHILSIGTFTYTADSRFRVEGDHSIGEYNLEIKQSNINDTGKYVCEILNSPKPYQTYVVMVQEKLVEFNPSYDKYVEVGDVIMLSCSIRRIGHKSEALNHVSWYLNDTLIDFDSYEEDVSIHTEDLCIKSHATSRLKIRKANVNNAGTYKCKASYGDSAVSTSITVYIISASTPAGTNTKSSSMQDTNQLSRTHEPYFDDNITTNVTVFTGSTALLKCKFHNLNDYLIVWTQPVVDETIAGIVLAAGSLIITRDSRFTVLQNDDESILEIRSITTRDRGVYECRMSTESVQKIAFTLTVQENL